MTTKLAIESFLVNKVLAVVGVSRSEKKFSYILYRELKAKGYQVFAVNPNTATVGGDPCYKSITSLPQPVDGVVIVVPPSQTKKVIEDAVAAGIKHIWIQQGAESEDVIKYCQRDGIDVIHHQCILMFAEPTGFPHNVHRCIWRILAKIPK